MDAKQLLDASLKSIKKIDEAFSPADIGARLRFTPARSEAAARELADFGIFDLSFDGAAQLTRDFSKTRAATAGGAVAAAKPPRKPRKKLAAPAPAGGDLPTEAQ